MLGFLGAVNPVAALGSALSLGESAVAYKGQMDTNESNERIARENRAFQERMANTAMDYQTDMVERAEDYSTSMSNTAYQRGMDDMRKAGLNPILAYSQGGASTPIGYTAPGVSATGSTATMQNPLASFRGITKNFMDAATTASDLQTASVTRDRMNQEIDNMAEQLNLTTEQTKKVKVEAEKLAEEMDYIDAQTEGVEADNEKRKALASFIRSNPNAAIVSEYGGKGVIPLTTILGSLGLNELVDFALDVVDKAKENAPSFNVNMRETNPLTDRY